MCKLLSVLLCTLNYSIYRRGEQARITYYQFTLIHADITLQTIHTGVTYHKIYFSFDELSMIFTSYFKYFLTCKLQLQPSNNEVKATTPTHPPYPTSSPIP